MRNIKFWDPCNFTISAKIGKEANNQTEKQNFFFRLKKIKLFNKGLKTGKGGKWPANCICILMSGKCAPRDIGLCSLEILSQRKLLRQSLTDSVCNWSHVIEFYARFTSFLSYIFSVFLFLLFLIYYAVYSVRMFELNFKICWKIYVLIEEMLCTA